MKRSKACWRGRSRRRVERTACNMAVAVLRDDEFRKIGEARADTIGRYTQFLNRHVQAIDPEGRIPEPPGARRVPAGKGGKGDFLFLQPEGVDAHLIGARVRLECLDPVGAEMALEKALKP